ARACSAVLKGRLTHAELTDGLDAAASEEVAPHSFKTEEKTVTAGDVAREEGPNPWRPSRSVADSPPVHQLGVSPTASDTCRCSAVKTLLRKEVIQPHLPVRLPCYDFTPITDPTFDGSLPEGWATGFGCYRLSWCD